MSAPDLQLRLLALFFILFVKHLPLSVTDGSDGALLYDSHACE